MNYRWTVLLVPLLALAACDRRQEAITGEVEATEIDVGTKIPGRLAEILVREGDAVTKDQVLGVMQSRETEAKLSTVLAARKEAADQLAFAEATYRRMKSLYEQSVIPRQQFDEVSYKYNAARQKLAATEGQLNEVKSYNDEALIKAPLRGEVTQVVSHAGEIVSPGYPVITIVDLDDEWVTFNLREDLLKKVKKGAAVDVAFPALGKESHPFTVTYISALGTFAKWKSTNEQGSFDLKTFEVRARSEKKIEDLRPGMTALIHLR